VFFATEIVLGDWVWNDIPRLLLASSTGLLISRFFLGAGPLFPVKELLPITHDLLWVLPLAIVLGAGGPAYQKLLHLSGATKRLPFALLWSGLAVGVLGLMEPKVWGNGDAALMEILQNKTMLLGVAGVLVCRLVATTFCVGTGTVEESLLLHSSSVLPLVSRQLTFCIVRSHRYWLYVAWDY